MADFVFDAELYELLIYIYITYTQIHRKVPNTWWFRQSKEHCTSTIFNQPRQHSWITCMACLPTFTSQTLPKFARTYTHIPNIYTQVCLWCWRCFFGKFLEIKHIYNHWVSQGVSSLSQSSNTVWIWVAPHYPLEHTKLVIHPSVCCHIYINPIPSCISWNILMSVTFPGLPSNNLT